METNLPTPYWSIQKRIAFRFVFCFFVLFIIIQNNGAFPLWNYVMAYPTDWLHAMIPWVGKHVLQLPYDITVFTNGSGDTTYDYVIVFCILIISLISTAVWSILDRSRTNYQTLYYWLTVIIRFYVGMMLISYGLVKVIKLQFPSPGIYRLTQIYGDSSPMGLAWTFLGFSKGYNLFMGAAEVAAILLLFRRTMTFGAIITLMTTANVMAVNYFYDVPVKILSTGLFVMTFFLLLHDAERLLKFFFSGQQVSLPLISAPQLKEKWQSYSKIAIKAILIGYSLIYGTIELLEVSKTYGDNAPKPKFYGLYNVDLFVVNQDTLPPLTTDSIRWDRLAIEWEGYAKVQYMNDSINRFFTNFDTTGIQKVDITLRTDSTINYKFDYSIPDKDKFNLRGVLQNDSIIIHLSKKDLSSYRLTSRGFNWINEYPYNR